ncbi:hypothetical protein [Streptomyces sp. NPDC001135]
MLRKKTLSVQAEETAGHPPAQAEGEATALSAGNSSDAPQDQPRSPAQDVGAAVARGAAGGLAKGIAFGAGKRLWKVFEGLWDNQ